MLARRFRVLFGLAKWWVSQLEQRSAVISYLYNTPHKHRETAGTGGGMATGMGTSDRTRTRVTRNRDTAGLPAPVLFPNHAQDVSDFGAIVMSR